MAKEQDDFATNGERRTVFDDRADEGQAARSHVLPTEMTIDIRPDQSARVDYYGTAQMLIDEGLVPAHVEWPDSGDKRSKEWRAGDFEYSLWRACPPGIVGGGGRQRRMHDWWRLCVDWNDGGDPRYAHVRAKQFALQRKHDELAKLQSMEGQMERHRVLCRLYRAQEDQKFRAFLSGMVPEQKKPGRKAKGASHG